MPDAPQPLSEDTARRLLARAAELDAQIGTAHSVAELRHAAIEAGITPAAFERALQDFPAEHEAPKVGRWQALWGPLAAVGSFWISLGTLARAATALGADWQVRGLVDLVALGIGAAIGRRLGARRTSAVLLGLAAAQFALWVVHMIWGIRAAQGAPVHWAVLIAGAGGALLATLGAPAGNQPARPPLVDSLGQVPSPPSSGRSDTKDPNALQTTIEGWGLTTASS